MKNRSKEKGKRGKESLKVKASRIKIKPPSFMRGYP